jgi:hypothetical protein
MFCKQTKLTNSRCNTNLKYPTVTAANTGLTKQNILLIQIQEQEQQTYQSFTLGIVY